MVILFIFVALYVFIRLFCQFWQPPGHKVTFFGLIFRFDFSIFSQNHLCCALFAAAPFQKRISQNVTKDNIAETNTHALVKPMSPWYFWQ